MIRFIADTLANFAKTQPIKQIQKNMYWTPALTLPKFIVTAKLQPQPQQQPQP